VPARHDGLRAVPADLAPVAWGVSPADVIREQRLGTPVVWVGKIVEFTYTPRDGKLVLEWICDYLPFNAAGERAMRQRPLSVGPPIDAERFLVNLIQVEMPEGRAESMKRDYAATPHYILVAGTVDSVVERGGFPTVFLYTREFELSRKLVALAQ
jgi:hypothetical protein